jgi:hypothetical protein
MHVCEFDHTDAAISGLASGRFSSFIPCGGGPSTTATSIWQRRQPPTPSRAFGKQCPCPGQGVVVVPLYPQFVLIKKENERGRA